MESIGPQVISPGLVFFKGALSNEQQIWLANYALKASSDGVHSFWETLPDGTKLLNSDVGRGRIYDDITKFPDHPEVTELCQNFVEKARAVDSKMPMMQPTHLLLLWYASDDGMIWHSDNDKNDGSNDHPIVSITIGNSCDFGYKIVGKKESILKLESGDILIWGGPNRMLPHCVEKVYMNTCPSFLPISNVRLNFTYRDAPEVRGREADFKYNVMNDYSLLPHLLQKVTPSENKD
eukprot:TRINITY_DN7548_c0_g1_i1.p1 TRINITY_DN7548_c0_g1~~TRINITY_DN7548_c0_g1_i1.p1  ORF type:complete len:236 (-),score=18.99 TRINITY_DN7548_c0_g1_i1:129-836(-)